MRRPVSMASQVSRWRHCSLGGAMTSPLRGGLPPALPPSFSFLRFILILCTCMFCPHAVLCAMCVHGPGWGGEEDGSPGTGVKRIVSRHVGGGSPQAVISPLGGHALQAPRAESWVCCETSSRADINRFLQIEHQQQTKAESFRELAGLLGLWLLGELQERMGPKTRITAALGGRGHGRGRGAAGCPGPSTSASPGIFLAAMDGVPFTLHPRFEGKSCGPLVSQRPWDPGA